MNYQLIQGDCIEVLKTLPANSVQCVVTSPPYFGLRSYLDADDADKPLEIGTEETPDAYVAKLVEVFREVRRILRDDGTVWLNLGDSYNGSGGAGGDYAAGGLKEGQPKYPGRNVGGLKPKDLIGVPWRVAFALQADGWWLRQDIIFAKKAPMPESVTDRCTKAHEYVFLLTKSANYYYDHIAIAEESIAPGSVHVAKRGQKMGAMNGIVPQNNIVTGNTRNKRSVWVLGPESYSGAHFAVMPSKLAEPCILAGSSAHGACAKCGAPWERIVEHISNPRREVGRFPSDYRANAKTTRPQGAGSGSGALTPTVITTGWQPTCTCGYWRCTCCSFVIQYPHESITLNGKEDTGNATQRPGEGESVQGGMGKTEVCPEQGMAGASQEEQADARKDVRAMRAEVYGAEEQPVLQPELLRKVDVAQRQSESVPAGPRTNQPLPEGLQAVQLQGIQDTSGVQSNSPARTSNGKCEGLCAGASTCDGGDCRAESAAGRSSTPQERHQDGQSARKPGTVDYAYASPVAQSGVPSLREAVCPHCGGRLVHEPAPVVPCVVLDPFNGSGTTGAVALKHNRHYIGIDLNAEYLELAHRRITKSQPLLLAGV